MTMLFLFKLSLWHHELVSQSLNVKNYRLQPFKRYLIFNQILWAGFYTSEMVTTNIYVEERFLLLIIEDSIKNIKKNNAFSH